MANGKKGLHPLAWVGIGCGGLLVLGLIVFVGLGAFVFNKGKDMVEEQTGGRSVGDFLDDLQEDPARVGAELVVRNNPDLKLIESNKEEGTITFENLKSGEVVTLDYSDISEGKFSMKSDEGEFSMDAKSEGNEGGVTFSGPDGTARIGGSTDLSDVPDWVPLPENTEGAQSAYHSTSGDKVNGALAMKVQGDPQAAIDDYKSVLEDEGWTIDSDSMTKTPQGIFGGVSASKDGQKVQLGIVSSKDGTQLTINYNGKK